MNGCMDKQGEKRNAIVIGGGLVGALCVCVLAKRGYQVTMFEKRNDIRKMKMSRGRSINLALSHRGRKALRLVELEAQVLKAAVPMKGRFLHTEREHTTSVPYDPVSNQSIYSVGRNFLNNILLNEAEKYPNVNLCFNHKLVDVDFEEQTITLQCTNTNETLKTSADFIVGADGAFSALRYFLQRTPLFDFTQSFIDHGYLELCIPTERGDRLKPNHLHIWPRGEFMMIALPNQDGSWTVTLFMPFKKFKSINTPRKLIDFFKTTFDDALPLIGRNELESCFFANTPSSLVSIKCGRYDMDDKFLIIGDAAHAMVPFYGQGMNAGFEDCTILNKILDQVQDNIPETVKLFTERRQKDAHAICDLAMYNYVEMRDLVTKPTFMLRKVLDTGISKLLPDIWVPLYNSVTFSHMGYSQCIENKRWQDKVLIAICITMVVMVFILAL